MTDTTGTWMYAVTDGTLVGHETEGASGVAGEQVRTVQEGGLTAVVGTVPLDDFGEAALARNLEDLDWLERVPAPMIRSSPDWHGTSPWYPFDSRPSASTTNGSGPCSPSTGSSSRLRSPS